MTKRSVPRRRRAAGLGWRWGVAALLLIVAWVVAIVLVLDYVPNVFRVAPVSVGETAPTFALESSGGERIDLADYIGRKAVLLVFHGGYR